jgi:hypothetical protein
MIYRYSSSQESPHPTPPWTRRIFEDPQLNWLYCDSYGKTSLMVLALVTNISRSILIANRNFPAVPHKASLSSDHRHHTPSNSNQSPLIAYSGLVSLDIITVRNVALLSSAQGRAGHINDLSAVHNRAQSSTLIRGPWTTGNRSDAICRIFCLFSCTCHCSRQTRVYSTRVLRYFCFFLSLFLYAYSLLLLSLFLSAFDFRFHYFVHYVVFQFHFFYLSWE